MVEYLRYLIKCPFFFIHVLSFREIQKVALLRNYIFEQMDNGPTQNASALLTLWTNWNLDLNVVDRALVRIIASK